MGQGLQQRQCFIGGVQVRTARTASARGAPVLDPMYPAARHRWARYLGVRLPQVLWCPACRRSKNCAATQHWLRHRLVRCSWPGSLCSLATRAAYFGACPGRPGGDPGRACWTVRQGWCGSCGTNERGTAGPCRMVGTQCWQALPCSPALALRACSKLDNLATERQGQIYLRTIPPPSPSASQPLHSPITINQSKHLLLKHIKQSH